MVCSKPERAVPKKTWLAAEQPYGKRLVAALPVRLPYDEKRYGKLAPALCSMTFAAASGAGCATSFIR